MWNPTFFVIFFKHQHSTLNNVKWWHKQQGRVCHSSPAQGNIQRHQLSVTLLAGLSHPTRGTDTLPSCWVALPSLPTGAQFSTVLPVKATQTTCRNEHVYIHAQPQIPKFIALNISISFCLRVFQYKRFPDWLRLQLAPMKPGGQWQVPVLKSQRPPLMQLHLDLQCGPKVPARHPEEKPQQRHETGILKKGALCNLRPISAVIPLWHQLINDTLT